MKTKRRLFSQNRKKPKETGEVALQITSMADIFTILLVFLLKGLSSDAIQISPNSGTKLPSGIHTTQIAEQALQIELSQASLLIEKNVILNLNHYQLDPSAIAKDGTIAALTERLIQERERQKIISKENDTVKIDSKAIILSDEKIPFSTMKLVLKTLSSHGYSEIKFGVIKE